jgi:hypothetical protein
VAQSALPCLESESKPKCRVSVACPHLLAIGLHSPVGMKHSALNSGLSTPKYCDSCLSTLTTELNSKATRGSSNLFPAGKERGIRERR